MTSDKGEASKKGLWTSTLGCIADDLTGASDLASVMRRSGLSVRLCIGVPDLDELQRHASTDAVIVALPIRSVEPEKARSTAHSSLQVLLDLGIRSFYNKYCSTFDSTDRGNIGPVTEELMSALGVERCWHVPSYPENGRTVYLGHLFVGDALLSESPMRNHPRTPMTDANIVRVLGRQATKPVSLFPLTAVRDGRMPNADIRDHIIADAVTDSDVMAVAAMSTDGLAAGGAPFGAALACQLAASASARERRPSGGRSAPQGQRAVVVGSASARTREQVASFHGPVIRVNADEPLMEILVRARQAMTTGPVLVAAEDLNGSGQPADADALLMESRLGAIAVALVDDGVDQLVVAGGETSGAVAHALGLRSMAVQEEIAPGVPWTYSEQRKLFVTFKSGNFGSPSFFADAFRSLERA